MYIIEVRRTFAADTLDALPKLPVKHTRERALWRRVRRVRHKRRRPVAQHRYSTRDTPSRHGHARSLGSNGQGGTWDRRCLWSFVPLGVIFRIFRNSPWDAVR